MKLLLYTLAPPRGRCLLLAQQLHLATGLDHSRCVRVAMSLFAGNHPRGNAIAVDAGEGVPIGDLEVACAEFGIEIEGIEVGETTAREG